MADKDAGAMNSYGSEVGKKSSEDAEKIFPKRK